MASNRVACAYDMLPTAIPRLTRRTPQSRHRNILSCIINMIHSIRIVRAAIRGGNRPSTQPRGGNAICARRSSCGSTRSVEELDRTPLRDTPVQPRAFLQSHALRMTASLRLIGTIHDARRATCAAFHARPSCRMCSHSILFVHVSDGRNDDARPTLAHE